MQSTQNIELENLRLLSSLDLEEVLELSWQIIKAATGAKAVSAIIWDEDLENYVEEFTFGESKQTLRKLSNQIIDDSQKLDTNEIDLDEYKIADLKQFDPIYVYSIIYDDSYLGCFLVAKPDISHCTNFQELSEIFKDYSFSLAVSHAWQFSELSKENDRLRNRYQELEETNSVLQDQVTKFIRDTQANSTLREIRTERDRLVYQISSIVSQQTRVQAVMENSVTVIAKGFRASRCLIFRIRDFDNHLEVFEYHDPLVPQSKELFFTDDGLKFAQIATERSSTHTIGDRLIDLPDFFDQQFLKHFSIRSGLITSLKREGKTLGVLFLQDCINRRDWNIDDIAIMNSLSTMLAIAIDNAELHEERERQSLIDGLTGIANRRKFNETFEPEMERAIRHSDPLSLIVIDLDYLKKINDNHGHKAGDAAIKAVADVLKNDSRSIDLAARYGGEEFCLLLPKTELDMATQIAERLRKSINDCYLDNVGNISASLGVANYPAHATDAESLFRLADEALYRAKQNGRNQISIAKMQMSEEK